MSCGSWTIRSDRRQAPRDLAKALLEVAERSLEGDRIGAGEIYHLAGRGHCSWADFARGIIETSARVWRKAGGRRSNRYRRLSDPGDPASLYGSRLRQIRPRLRLRAARLARCRSAGRRRAHGGCVVASLSVSVAMATYNGAAYLARQVDRSRRAIDSAGRTGNLRRRVDGRHAGHSGTLCDYRAFRSARPPQFRAARLPRELPQMHEPVSIGPGRLLRPG